MTSLRVVSSVCSCYVDPTYVTYFLWWPSSGGQVPGYVILTGVLLSDTTYC